MQLTPQQKEAIEKISGPCVILAGAGTGKTFTIVEKIKKLINSEKYSPEKIVAITFSNEAANSLSSRVQKNLPWLKEKPIIKTFHAFSADIIREHGEKIGIKKEFRILTPDESKFIFHSQLKVQPGNCHAYVSAIGIAKDIGINKENLQEYFDKKLKKYEKVDLEKRLENLKFELQTSYLKKAKNKSDLKKEIKDLMSLTKIKKFLSAWNAYEKIKEKSNYQDYSDLNSNALKLLKNFPEISAEYDYIIVDEFQDTNKIQMDLIFLIAPHKNITVVGDLNQSIYRFRGAYNKNIEEFKERFEITKVYNLDKSHRSSNKILRAAHKLILNNYSNKDECFLVENYNNREGEKIEIFETAELKEEARKIAEIVDEKIKNGKNPNEICIMFRNHNYGRIIRRCLEFKGINYSCVSKSSLLDQKSIKSITNYLTIIKKIKNKEKGGEQDWWEIIHSHQIQDEDLIKIGSFIRKNSDLENLSVYLLNNLKEQKLNDSTKLSLNILTERIKLMLPFVSEEIPSLIQKVFNISGLLNTEDKQKKKEMVANLNKFYELSVEHSHLYDSTLSGFLHYLEILKELNIEIETPENEENGVKLMTLHSTKGLEYDTVILSNMAQKRFPMESKQSNTLLPIELFPEFKNVKEEDLEYVVNETERKLQISEERRLCYVAFTRAKNNLIITYAKNYGQKEFSQSQFLDEINYKENPDTIYQIDNKLKYEEKIEQKKSFNFSSILGKQNFENQLINLLKITEMPEKKLQKEIVFSPSSLLLFSECQKKFEYKYIYDMPQGKNMNWESLRLGSFLHSVLEKGVKENFPSLEDFISFAHELKNKEEWSSVNLEEIEFLLKVFYERNKNKFTKESLTEIKLPLEIEGIKFIGYADRIDINPDGIEIVDYKTGASVISPKNRNWQLGFYALAASEFGKVKKITLDMLRHDKPLEFALDEKGNAKAVEGRMEFNIHEVKKEMLEEARKVNQAVKKGFQQCSLEKNCDFCSEYFYNL